MSPPLLRLWLYCQASFAAIPPAMSMTRTHLLTASYAKSASTSSNFCVPFASTASDPRDAALAIEFSPRQENQGNSSYPNSGCVIVFFFSHPVRNGELPPQAEKSLPFSINCFFVVWTCSTFSTCNNIKRHTNKAWITIVRKWEGRQSAATNGCVWV